MFVKGVCSIDFVNAFINTFINGLQRRGFVLWLLSNGLQRRGFVLWLLSNGLQRRGFVNGLSYGFYQMVCLMAFIKWFC